LQCLNDNIRNWLMPLILAFILMPFLLSPSWALDLELIAIIDGDSTAEDLGYNVQSPGDMDGDGFSEVFVGSKVERFIKAFNGGHPADDIPEMTLTERERNYFKWIDDVNGDSYRDFAAYKWTYTVIKAYEIYFGGPDFYEKTEPDISFTADYQEGFRYVFCEDFNGDGINELMIQGEHPDWPIQSKYYIYETGPDMDTTVDYIFKIMYDGIATVGLSRCVGDINDDGYADFVTSSGPNSKPGYIQLYMGSPDHDSIPDVLIWSPFPDAPGVGYFGHDILPAGDLNRDGFDDIIITSIGFPPSIFYGGDPIDTIPKILQYPGTATNLCGDINHDGWEDIVVGYTTYDVGSGAIFVYFGAFDMDTICDIAIPYNALPAIAYHFGKSVGPAGDFDGDGVDDIAVGSDATINDNYNEGRMFIFAGDSNLPTPAEDEPDVPIPIDYDILKQNYPNPFNNSTIIEYSLHGILEREVELSIYNILGQKIRILYSGLQSGGEHVMFWDGLDDMGHDVPSGIYFYRLKSGHDVISKKMLHLK
jgi:hypothetical protein